MKKADLKKAIADGTPVAVDAGYKTRGEFPRSAKRAVVVSIDQQRRVHSGARYDIGGHIAKDGVRVRYDEDVEYRYGKRPISGTDTWGRADIADRNAHPFERVVGPRDVLDTWENYVRDRERVLGLAAVERDRLESMRAECEAAVASMGAGRVRALHDRSYETTGYLVELLPAEAAAIAEKVTTANEGEVRG